MTKLLILSLVFCVSTSSFARVGGDETHNGGGVAEQNVIFAWMNMREILINFCSLAPCADEEAQKIIQSIYEHGDVDLLNGQLIFASRSKRPDLFPSRSDQFATKPEWGAKIYVNTDALANLESPLEIIQAIEHLMKALLRHAQAEKADGAQSLTDFVLTFAQGRYSENPMISFNQPEVRLLNWNYGGSTRLIVADVAKTYELTGPLLAKLTCPVGLIQSSVTVTNLTWGDLLPWDEENQQQNFAFRGDVLYECSSKTEHASFSADFQGLLRANVTVNGKPSADWMSSPISIVSFIENSLEVLISNRRQQP